MAERTYGKNEIVYREGESGDTFFRVLEGAVRIVTDLGMESEKTLTVLTPGMFFGELSAAAGYPRSATAAAGEEGAKLLELGDSDLDKYFREQPEMILDLMRYLGSRIRSLSAECEEARSFLEKLDSGDAKPRTPSFMDRIRRVAALHAKDRPSMEARSAPKAASPAGSTLSRVTAYPAGTVLYREGETAECMYCIHWGRVGIFSGYGTDEKRKLTELSVNQFFGEMGMLCGDPRSATAVILEDDTALEAIFERDIEDMFRENPSRVWMILEHIGLRLRRLTAEYTDVCRRICEKA